MPAKLYRIKLTTAERQELKSLILKGKAAARKQNHARILLLCDENSSEGCKKDDEVMASLITSRSSVERVRQRFVEEGLESAINPKPKSHHRPKKLDGSAEAFLLATACSAAPGGRTRWTLQLLADRLVECGMVDSISHEAVRQTLKKMNSNPG